MSNLAYQREVKQYQTEQQGQSVVIKRRGSITLGEKSYLSCLSWLLCAAPFSSFLKPLLSITLILKSRN